MNSDIPHEPAVGLLREDVVDAFPVRGAACDAVERARCASLGGSKKRIDEANPLSPATRNSAVPLLSLFRESLPYAPSILQSSSPPRTPVLALASIKTKTWCLVGTPLRILSKASQRASFSSLDVEASVGAYATTNMIALDLPARLKVIDMRRSLTSSCVHVALRMIDFFTANPTPCCLALPLPPSAPQQKTRYPAATNSGRPGLRVSCSPMTSQPSSLHLCKTTSGWPAPLRPVRESVRTLYVATVSSPLRDLVLATCSILRFSRLPGRACLLISLRDLFLFFPWSIYLGTALHFGLAKRVQPSHSASAAISSLPNPVLTHAGLVSISALSAAVSHTPGVKLHSCGVELKAHLRIWLKFHRFGVELEAHHRQRRQQQVADNVTLLLYACGCVVALPPAQPTLVGRRPGAEEEAVGIYTYIYIFLSFFSRPPY